MNAKFIKNIYIVFIVFLIVSCKSETTLQSYFVEHADTDGYVVSDISKSLLQINPETLSEDEKKALDAIEGINFLIFKRNEDNEQVYKAEAEKLNGILAAIKYEDLLQFNNSNGKFTVKSLGAENEIKEFIFYGDMPKIGLGVVRILGDEMKSEYFATLMNVAKSNTADESQLSEIMSFFK